MGEVIQFRSRQNRTPGDDDTVHVALVRGDSMMPTAGPGDVWVFRAADRYDGPGIYCITDGCYPQFKRLEASDVGRVLIVSDNPLYGPQEVGLGGLQILGIAVAVMR